MVLSFVVRAEQKANDTGEYHERKPSYFQFFADFQ